MGKCGRIIIKLAQILYFRNLDFSDKITRYMEEKSEKSALIRVNRKGSAAVDESVANAIALWADASSDSESLRRADLVRLKTKAIAAFFAFAGKAASEVMPMDVKAWREEMEARGLKLATIYCRLSFLSSFYEWMMRDPELGEHIRKNPVNLARPKAPKPYQTESSKALSDEQLERLRAVIRARADLGEVAAVRDYALFLFFAVSGMRRAEVLNLDGKDLEFREEGIVVTCKVKGGDYIGRLISRPEARAALIEYLKASDRMDALEKGGPLWVRHDRGAEAVEEERTLSAWGFVLRMKEYANEAGIGRFHVHQLRHTFARIAGESSGSLVETQEALGHKNLATTRVYMQRIPVKRDKFGAEVAKRLKL
jgi:site-specific recombinase XerC